MPLLDPRLSVHIMIRERPVASLNSEDYEVCLLGREGHESIGVFVVGEETGDCTLTLSSSVGKFASKSSDYFEALCRIREQLEAIGWRPVCYGASRKVFPSGMARDMGHGLKAYKLELRRHGRTADLVEIFDYGPDVEPVTVAEQASFFQEWLNSLGT